MEHTDEDPRQPPLHNHGANLAKPLKDFAAPHANDLQSSINAPIIDTNNFELKPALVNMVQQNQFAGVPNEDPHLHLSIFLDFGDTLKINNVSNDAIRLRLFPFSLRDRARAWLRSLAPNSITNWAQLSQTFLSKDFPPSKTAQLRNPIPNLRQRDGESLCETWDRFKELLRVCLHHGLEKWLIVQTFYDGFFYI